MVLTTRPNPESSAWWGIWTGPGAAPGDLVRLDAVACNQGCYPEYHECYEPGLAALLAAVGQSMCNHSANPLQPCAGCAMALRELAEIGSRSVGWEVNEAHIWAQVAWALQAYARAGLLDAVRAERLTAAYDGEADPTQYLTGITLGLAVSWGSAYEVFTSAHDHAGRSPFHFAGEGISPRDALHNPPRGAYARAEREIAQRKGWPQPQRFMLEERIRACAVASLNEANFVRLCTRAGVRLIPKTGAPHWGIVGYSAELLDIPTEDRRSYAGSNLAKDLALGALREVQWEEPGGLHENAWATWMALCSDAESLQGQPAPRGDGRWRWILPEVAEQAPTPALHPAAPPARRDVRSYLRERQGDVCAMCQIRRRGWTATTGQPIPAGLLGPALNLDHDHATGLVRGLLCTPCNSRAEPAGIRTREDVWRTYVTDPPIGDHQLLY